jgi:hypothetical protein
VDHAVDPPPLQGHILTVLLHLPLLDDGLPGLRVGWQRARTCPVRAQLRRRDLIPAGIGAVEASQEDVDGRFVTAGGRGVELIRASPETGPPVEVSKLAACGDHYEHWATEM